MKGRYQKSSHAPDAQEGDVGDEVHAVDGGDVIEVGVLLVIAFGALIRWMVSWGSRFLFSFFQVGLSRESAVDAGCRVQVGGR